MPTWADSDATFEGIFSVDPDQNVWRLDANVVSPTFKWDGKNLQRGQVFVPSLTGTIRQFWPMGGRTFFRGLIDLPGMDEQRKDEVFGSFDETQGYVQINLFGNLFNVSGFIDSGLSGAEDGGSNVQGN